MQGKKRHTTSFKTYKLYVSQNIKSIESNLDSFYPFYFTDTPSFHVDMHAFFYKSTFKHWIILNGHVITSCIFVSNKSAQIEIPMYMLKNTLTYPS